MIDYSPMDLLGRTFVDLPAEDGIHHQIKIIKLIADHTDTINFSPNRKKEDMRKYLIITILLIILIETIIL
jgi:hypothetical protein